MELRADCTRCAGLCCVVPAFAKSADFAVDKPAGTPCRNLLADFRCSIHDRLRDSGFPGCTVYDCFGAGQHLVQDTFGGRNWRDHPELAQPMFHAFRVMRDLHELLWYLTEARDRPEATPLRDDLGHALAETERLTGQDADVLVKVDTAAHRDAVNALLLRTSELVRAGRGPELRGADLIGKSFRGKDLRGANLRGAYLIGADLRDADVRSADLIGADLRGADLRGTRLDGSLFLTQFQVNAARGDQRTRLAHSLTRPPHW